MRILLVNPPNSGKNIIEEKYGVDVIRKAFKGEPLSLEILAGNLRTESVDIFDMKVDTTTYSQKLKEFEPDLVGITCMTCEANTALRIMRETKDYNSEITTVVGGVHATNDPEFFNQPFVDYIVVGVGEKAFSDLIKQLKQGKKPTEIPGVGVRMNGKLHITPKKYGREDMIEGVLPNRELVRKYRREYCLENQRILVGFVNTAYGCTHRCNFCCLWKTTNGKYLAKTPEAVLRDIELCEPFFIRLVDGNTFGDIKRAKEIALMIARKGINKLFIVDARADTISRQPELIEIWRKIGLKIVVVGFEEINDRSLESFNKKSKADANTTAIRILHDNNIDIIGDFIISPDYEEKDFDNLSEYVAKNKIEFPGFSVLTPLPGTPLYEQLKDRVIIGDLDYYTLTNSVIRTRLPEGKFCEKIEELYKRFYSYSLPKRMLAKVFLRESVIKAVHSAKRSLDRMSGSGKDLS